MTGTGRQRFSPYFPGALVAALGRPTPNPTSTWLLDWIHRPTFPGRVGRAPGDLRAAALRARRAPEPDLADAAVRLLDSTDADDSVRQWISERARAISCANAIARV